MEKECKFCHNLFKKNYKYSNKQWNKATYCSCSCKQKDRIITPKIIETLRRIATGRKQSLETKIKRGLYKTGKNNCHWKGGISYDELGYLRDNKTKKRIHRIVMEKKIGKKLNRYEVVHHKNGNKKDNRIENLIIVSMSEHAKIHDNLKGNRPWEING